VTLDGHVVSASASGTYAPAVAAGLHQLQITAPGYATYNGAIQVPGGALSRAITLFPESPVVAAFLADINVDRAADGRTPVQLDNQLTIAAFNHAVDMGTQGYYAHFDPNGFAPTTRSLLLGSEMVGDENIAGNYTNVADAEFAFVQNEKAKLPNQSAADCVRYGDPEYAGHYCNLIFATHNWVGLAVTRAGSVGNYPGITFYDQEFGDLYGMVDTTVIAREPTLNTVASLVMSGAPAATIAAGTFGDVVSTMQYPVPISLATLNADPTCASTCPAADQWYPTWGIWSTLGVLSVLATSANQIYEPQVTAATFSGTGASTIYWPGGNVMTAIYHDSSVTIQTQSRSRATTSVNQGFVVPNSHAMRARRR